MPLRIERLEDRLLPAATFRVLNGTLIISGDAAADSIGLVGGVQGELDLSVDQNGDSIRETTQHFSGVRSLYVATADGADFVEVRAVNLLGGAQFFTGNGNDRVELTTSVLRGEVRVGLGADHDEFELRRGSEVHGRLYVEGATGHDKLKLDERVRVTGDVVLLGGAGDDEAELQDQITVLGEVRLQLGDGNNQGRLRETVQVTQSVKYIGGSLDDALDLRDGVLVLGDVAVSTGDGHNEVKLETDIEIRGALSITTGGGNDDIDLRHMTTAGAVQIGGQVTIQTGGGSDTVDLHGAIDLDSLLVVKTGSGNDRLELGESSQSTTTRLSNGINAELGGGNDEFVIVKTTLLAVGRVNAGGNIDSADSLGGNLFTPNLLALNFEGGNLLI